MYPRRISNEGKRVGTPGTYLVPVVQGSHIYGFMPQLPAKTLANWQNMNVSNPKKHERPAQP